MIICPNCKKRNQDNYLFCDNCGTKLSEKQINTSDESTRGDIPQFTSSATGNAQTSRRPFGIGKIIAVAVAAVLVIVLFVNFVFGANLVYKLLHGLEKLSKMDKYTLDTKISLSVDSDDPVFDILNKFTYKTTIKADAKKMVSEAAINLLFKDKSVTKAVIGVNSEDLYLKFPDLYKKPFYYNLGRKYAGMQNDFKIIRECFEGINLKFDKKKYAEIISDALGNDMRKKSGKIIITLDNKNIPRLLEDVLEEAADDEKLMESIRTNAIKFFRNMLKEIDSFKSFTYIEEDELEEILENLEDKDEFEDMYEEGIEYLLEEIEYYNDYDYWDDMPEVELSFGMGAFNKIKSIGINFEYEDPYSDESIEMDIETKIKGGAGFTKLNKKNAVDLEDLASDSKLLKGIAEDVIGNLIKLIEKNKDLVNEIEDTFDVDLSDLEDQLLDMVDMFTYLPIN
jgi:hypothetical protein